jgi:hypothetical protein
MAYVKLDDQIAHHPKVLRAGAEAAWLWAVSIAYCNRQLTDGHVPAAALSTMGSFRTPPRKLAAALVAVGLFEIDGDGYQVHDYLSHNPDKATVQQRMRDAAQRTAASRERRGHAPVTPASQRDITVTGASSRGTRTSSTPTPLLLRRLPTTTQGARRRVSFALPPSNCSPCGSSTAQAHQRRSSAN